jgi:hypothetical protein
VELLEVDIVLDHGVHPQVAVHAVRPLVVAVDRHVDQEVLKRVKMFVAAVAADRRILRTGLRQHVLSPQVEPNWLTVTLTNRSMNLPSTKDYSILTNFSCSHLEEEKHEVRIVLFTKANFYLTSKNEPTESSEQFRLHDCLFLFE